MKKMTRLSPAPRLSGYLCLLIIAFLLSATLAVSADVPAKQSASKRQARRSSTAPKKVTSKKRTARKARNVRRFVSKKPTFPDPTIGDETTGEDLIVRQAAIDALGNLSGSMVAVDPNTGRILTIVNQKFAFASGYQPCSTFKPAVALAALQEGVITNDSTRLRLGRRWYMDLQQSLAHSNNIYFERLGTLLGLQRMRKYAEAFGFAEAAGWGIEKEIPGSFPEKPPPASMGGVGRIASFGQGISQTLLQEVAFVSTVGNGGTLYYLQYPKSEEELEDFQPRIKRQLDIHPWLKPVREGMEGAVTFGTARRAFQPDFNVLGKTGTCSQNGYKLGWFAGYSEYDGGLAVAVLQRTPQPMGGGAHAAAIAGRFFRRLADEKYSIRRVNQTDTTAPSALPAAIQIFR
ncbi:MAG: penicillin-binding protein [Acidobacteria bacterium]|nr:penicillin-binding protein [Acidobacteriota bacterium]